MARQDIKSAETKDNILNTALALFRQKGYEAVSVNEICKTLGLTKGAFYYHYASKSDILIYSYKEEADRMAQYYQSISSEKPLVKLKKFYNHFIDFFQPDRLEEMKIFFKVQIESHYENFLGSSRIQRDIFINILKEGQSSGEIREDIPAEILADIISRYRFGLHIEWCILDGKINLISNSTRDFEAILKLLTPPNA